MKPETIIALRKDAEKAKKGVKEDPTWWAGRGYFSAVTSTIVGVFVYANIICSAVPKQMPIIFVACSLLVVFAMISVPWYVVIRKEMQHKYQLLCEAILAVDESDTKAG